ncbi:3-oxoadipate enol-lactonase [Egicoccus sp. AB-alg6-2]|uniref:3-oxoadipate enol-lactonase n=1 Tax=Egicoccus sp. AB-alg6-2 TaxID=3242692 RepID=UPI00359D71BB
MSHEEVVQTDDGVRLRTWTDGDPDAPPLLLINSLGTDLSMWDAQVPGWSPSHRLLRYDQRGHGTSSVPDGPYTVARLGRDALTVLDHHGVERADVCGISLGGLVALWLAAHVPERVRRVVLADTAAKVGTEDAWRARAATVREQGMDAVVDLVLGRFFSPTFRAGRAPALARVEQGLRRAAPEGYAASCEALATADLLAEAAAVRAPCLVVVGTADEATPPADAQALHAALPHAGYAELPGAGHLANLEQPEPFERLVADFLTRPDLEQGHA